MEKIWENCLNVGRTARAKAERWESLGHKKGQDSVTNHRNPIHIGLSEKEGFSGSCFRHGWLQGF